MYIVMHVVNVYLHRTNVPMCTYVSIHVEMTIVIHFADVFHSTLDLLINKLQDCRHCIGYKFKFLLFFWMFKCNELV